MTAVPHSESLSFATSSNAFLFSTLPLTLESTTLPVEHTDHSQGLSPESLVLGTSAVVSSALTVGYVTWLLRGGSLVASFLASLPAWAAFDPLPVLISGSQQDNTNEDDDRLVDLVRDGAKPSSIPIATTKSDLETWPRCHLRPAIRSPCVTSVSCTHQADTSSSSSHVTIG